MSQQERIVKLWEAVGGLPDPTFQLALEALDVNNYVPVDEFIVDHSCNIERELIKKDTFKSLSEDAIDVIKLALDTSNSKRMLTKLLKTFGWKQLEINKIYREINRFIEVF